MRIRAAQLAFFLILPLAPAQQAPQTPTPNAVRAQALMADALKAFSSHDYETAAKLFDQVREVDPKKVNLNAMSGFAAFHLGRNEEAIRYFQQQQAITPDSVKLYAAEALAQIALNRPGDALGTLQTWVNKEPDSPVAAAQLVALYLDFQDGPGALAAANKALETIPQQTRNDPHLLHMLGRAQIMAGNTDAGVATLAALLKDEDDPGTINDIVYELAKTGKQLPLAESAERTAIADLASEARTWTLDDETDSMAKDSYSTIASWDTLGWILFKEAKYREAKDLVTASWLNSPHTEVGEHLGDIENRLGNPNEALHAYELALATIPTQTTSTDASLDRPQVDSLQEKIDALKKAGAESSLTDPAAVILKKLRTVPLGPAGALQGEARYLLLLDRNHVINASPAGEASIPGADKIMLKAAIGQFFPTGSDMKLVKFATLNCNSATCDLIFEP